MLSIAYHLVLDENAVMYRFRRWSASHKHPSEKDIPSHRSSELFGRGTGAV